MSLVGKGLEECGRDGEVIDGDSGFGASAVINDGEIFWVSRINVHPRCRTLT